MSSRLELHLPHDRLEKKTANFSRCTDFCASVWPCFHVYSNCLPSPAPPVIQLGDSTQVQEKTLETLLSL